MYAYIHIKIVMSNRTCPDKVYMLQNNEPEKRCK